MATVNVNSEGPYDVGDRVIIEGEVIVEGSLTNLSNPEWIVRKPSEDLLDPAAVLANPSTGSYTGIIDLVDESGRWYYRLEGTGLVQGAGEAWFDVRPRRA